jgi:protein-tyrosine kinase
MPTSINPPNTLITRRADDGKYSSWNQADAAHSLGTDLSLQAVQINSIFADPASAEELQLVQRLFFLARSHAPRVVVFCGIGSRDYAELVCARAAETLASQVLDPVCLLDANLKDATMHQRYDLDNASALSGRNAIKGRDSSAHNNPRNFWVLPASALRDSCPGLSPDLIREQISKLTEKFRYLLICAPPLESAPDGFLWGQVSDGLVVVLQADSTDRSAALKVRRWLDDYDIRLLGAVLKQQPEAHSLVGFRTTRD